MNNTRQKKNVTVSAHQGLKDSCGLGAALAAFAQRFQENPDDPALELSHPSGAPDQRVRTARVKDDYLAVLWEIATQDNRDFILANVLPAAEALELARTKMMTFNHVNGVTELRDVAPEDLATLASADAPDEAAVDDEVAVEGVRASSLWDGLTDRGIDEATLRDELGLSSAAIAVLRQGQTDAEAAEGLKGHPEWEKQACTGLLNGMTVAEIREELRLDEGEVDPGVDPTSDEALRAGLNAPAARMEFSVAPGEEEMQRILDSGSLAAWSTFLHPSQRQAVKAEFKGSARVVGGAGTGKTVVVLHRTSHLLSKDPQARVLLTTYTRSLASALYRQMAQLDPNYVEAPETGAAGLTISGIDALVSEIVKKATPEERGAALASGLGINRSFLPGGLSGKLLTRLWDQSAAAERDALPAGTAAERFLSQEYLDVVLAQGITTQAGYLRAKRTGRGTSLTRAERKAVWRVIEGFHARCAAEQRLPFPAIAIVAAEILRGREGHLFDHVLIDEAQDFHPGHWRLLRALVAEGPNDIFLAEDSHQRIYGTRQVLSHYGIVTKGRASIRLRISYRSTAETLRYAEGLLSGEEWVDSSGDADSLHGYRAVRRGPQPMVLSARSKAEEAELIADRIRDWLADGSEVSIGVLAHQRSRCEELQAQLSDEGIPLSHGAFAEKDLPVVVQTMHGAKGMEFTHVVLASVNAKEAWQIAREERLPEAERDTQRMQSRALLYVAASRARDQLVVSSVGEPSELLSEAGETAVQA